LDSSYFIGVGKRRAVKDDEKELPKEHVRDFEYFNGKHDELCLKHKNEFIAVKNQQFSSNRDPLRLLEILNENKINPKYAVTEFMKDR
jgi:hypothetical protein